MASGSDSEHSVLVVEDASGGKPGIAQPRAFSQPARRNFCIERDGVPLPRPMTPAARPSTVTAEGTSVPVESYRAEPRERGRNSRRLPQKRARVSRVTETDADLYIIEVEKRDDADANSHRQTSMSMQQNRRKSARLRQKKETSKVRLAEFNLKQLRKDRIKRDHKGIARRSSIGMRGESISTPGLGPIEVFDDDDDDDDGDDGRRRSVPTEHDNDPFEQFDHRDGIAVHPKISPRLSRSEDEVVPVDPIEEEHEAPMGEYANDEENLSKRSRDSGAVDAPYTGSTQLIFEFPPGKRGKIRVTEEERGRLSQRKYLNDSLIDFYIKYHESDLERRAEELRFTTTFFSSFFFGRLRRIDPIDYEGVKGWTKKVDIFTKQFVFVPICDSYHWSLIIVANLDKVEDWIQRKEEFSQASSEAPRIIYLDSLDPKRGTEFGETIRQYLVEEWLSKKIPLERNTASRKALSLTFKKLIPILRPNVPIQTNEYDCGLYLLNSFEMFLYNTDGLRDKLLSGIRDVRNAYSHVEITVLRKSIINLMDILEGQWTNEQSPPNGEASERVPEDLKELADETNTADTGIPASKSMKDPAADIHDLTDTDKEAMKISDCRAPSLNEMQVYVLHRVRAEGEESNFLHSECKGGYEQRDSTNENGVTGELERARDQVELDSDHLSIESPRDRDSEQRYHGQGISTQEEDEHISHDSVQQKSTDRLHESSETPHIPVDYVELLTHRPEESNHETSEDHEEEDGAIEISNQTSSVGAARQTQNGFGGSRFSGQPRARSANSAEF